MLKDSKDSWQPVDDVPVNIHLNTMNKTPHTGIMHRPVLLEQITLFFYSKKFLLYGSILLIGLTVRLVATFELASNSPFFFQPIIDAWRYDQLAQALASSWIWPEPGPFYQPPGYPYFLGMIYRLFGHSYLHARIIQSVMGACSCLLVANLGWHFSRKYWVSWLSGLFVALYGPLIYFELDLLATGLTLFLTLIALRLFISFFHSENTFFLFASGLVYGVSVICWPLTGVLAAGAMVYLAYRSRTKWRQAFLHISLIGAGLITALLPVSIYNFTADTTSPISTGGAFNLYLGNNLNWEETSLIRPGFQWMSQITLPYRLYGEEEVSRIGHSTIFYREIGKYIAEHPWTFLKTQLIKTYQLLNGYEIISPTDPYFFKQYSPLLNVLIFKLDLLKFPYGLLLPLAVTGAFFRWRSKKRGIQFNGLLFVLFTAMFIGLSLFPVTARYRLFIIPFLSIFAAFGTSALFKLSTQKTRQTVLVLLLVSLSYYVANVDIFDLEKNYTKPEIRSQPYFALGRILIRQGQFQEAIVPLQQAIAIDPGYADAWVDLGRANFMTGNKAAAVTAMEKANEVSPGYPLPLYNLALIYDAPGGSHQTAVMYYTRYLKVAEESFEAKMSALYAQRIRTVKERLKKMNKQ